METKKRFQALISHGDYMKAKNAHKLIIASFILLLILACNALASVPTATPSPVPPTATVVPPTTIAATSVPLSQQVTLISALDTETNQTPPYTITAQTPQLAGSDDP